MSQYSEYFLNSRSSVVQLDLLEITHPNFTKPYRIVRNDARGVTVDLSDAEEGVAFEYYPARVEQMGARDDLDSGIKIELGDVGEVVPGEIDAVADAGGFLTKPAMRYWVFRSDILDAPIYGPMTFEVPSFTLTAEGAAFEARAPALNSTKTGERQTLERIPPQRGFL